jgi:hypothetical protein
MVDHTTHGAPLRMNQTFDDEDIDEMDLTSTSESTERVKQIVTASVLAALSIAVAPVASFVPRIPGWGIAVFDPVSIFWIISFLLGGPIVGLLSTTAGTLGLFLYDPTAIGPVFKLLATLPMILVPWFGVRRLRSEVGGGSLSKVKFYGMLMFAAFILRLAIMVPVNLAYGAIAYPFFTIEFIIGYALILNGFQSLWDALIPFVIVHKTDVFRVFKMW